MAENAATTASGAAESATSGSAKAASAKASSGEKGPKHTPRTEKPRGRRKTRIGYVVSDKMQKTIVVELEDRVKHPLYAHHHEGQGARRERHRRCRRPGFADGDPPVVGHQAVAARRDSREGQVAKLPIGRAPRRGPLSLVTA